MLCQGRSDEFGGLLEQVATRRVPRSSVDHYRIHLSANIHHVGATSMEAASGGNVDRTRDFTGGFDLFRFGGLLLLRDDGN